MNRILRPAFCILLLSTLMGCASYETRKIPPSTAGVNPGKEFSSSFDTIEVRGYSFADKDTARTYLGIDPVSTGMAPIFLSIQNNGDDPIKVDLSRCFLTSSGGEGYRWLTLSECCDRARRGDAGPVLGATLAFGVTGAMISANQVADVNRSLDQDYYNKQFRPTLLNSGAKGEGVLFFDVSKDKFATIRSLVLNLVNVSTNEAKEIHIQLSL